VILICEFVGRNERGNRAPTGKKFAFATQNEQSEQ
jgi:hypothetical protein